MSYAVKEIFLTLQGEGAHAGRVAVFCRFAGCNLWTGREEDRADAVCRFCDTDFIGMDGTLGGRYPSADDLADTIAAQWAGAGDRYVVLTGGEPLLQVDAALVQRYMRVASPSRSRPTARWTRPTASTGSASARKPARLCGFAKDMSSNWCIRRLKTRRSSSPASTSSGSRCSRWTVRRLRTTRFAPSTTACIIRNGG